LDVDEITGFTKFTQLIKVNDTGKSKEDNDDSQDPREDTLEALFDVVLADILPLDIIRL